MTTATEEKLSFEDAMQQLETIVQQLEQGELPLEQALQQFERAIRLSRISQTKLQQAEQKVSQLLQQNGEAKLTAFDATETSE